MLRLGVLPEGYIYPKAQRPVRDLLRKRGQLVHQQTANVLSVQNILVRNTGSRLSANRIKGLSQAEVDVLLPDSDQALAVSSALAVVSCLAKQIQTIEKRVRTQMQRTPLYDLWTRLLRHRSRRAIPALCVTSLQQAQGGADDFFNGRKSSRRHFLLDKLGKVTW